MNYEEIRGILHLVNNSAIVRRLAVAVIGLTCILAVFFSVLVALIVFASYISGFIVCWFFIKYQKPASFYLQRFASFYRGHVADINHKETCSICENVTCSRQNSAIFPWKNLHIISELNHSIEHFYNRILDYFISSWYNSFTSDLTFLSELRISLRYATSSAINRYLELDAGQVICKKLMPCAVKHIDDYLCMQKIAKLKNVCVNDIAVEYYGKRLHIATTNRKNELGYLRQLSACLLPKVLPSRYVKCKNFTVLMREIMAGWVLLPLMDVLADPNMINSLVIIAATYKWKEQNVTQDKLEYVEFLHNFVNKDTKHSSFACDLKSVFKTTNLLYAFMQYLKKEGPVHIFQFCLDIEDFNSKLLTPDMTNDQLKDLHSKALNLYKIYFDKSSADFIGCSPNIILHFKQLLDDGVYNVTKLRTSEPLYQAYDCAFGILENEWLPPFFHSNEFYSYICGSKVTPSYTKTAPAKGKKYYESNQGTVAKISSGLGRIRGALRTSQPVEGAVYPPEFNIYANAPSAFVENMILTDYGTIFRDLTAWRISIPSSEIYQTGSSKIIHLFNINVQRIDTISENEVRHWVIQRRDQDFYTLKTKLIEFHGEICDSPLPSRKTSSTVDNRRTKYEDFLRSLLQKPALRGSDLLHTFLTLNQDFTMAITTTVPVVEDLGNIYQTVAFKLRKEKGQHLDSFMNTFLASTLQPSQTKVELAEVGDELNIFSIDTNYTPIPSTFDNPVFKDNFGIEYKKVEQSSSTSFHPNGVTESLFYLLKHTLKASETVLKLFAAVCSIAQHAVESMCRGFLERKLRTSLSQSNLAFLISLLEGVIFDEYVPPSDEELMVQRTEAFYHLEQAIPTYARKILGNNLKDGVVEILEILQNPLCNKQLAYSFLDLIVTEMYPQLGNPDV